MAAAATAMRSARGGPRRPFAPVTVSPSLAGNNHLAMEDAAVLGGASGKAAAKKAAERTPRTAARRRAAPGSCLKKCSAPAAANSPSRGVSEVALDKVRVVPSSPLCDGADQERRGRGEASASRKRTMEEAMAAIPEPGEGRVKYLVVTFERLLSLAAAAGGGGGPEARGRGAMAATKKDEATATATAETAPATPPPGAEEMDVSYPSSKVSFPAIPGVACILDASDRTSCIGRARGQRRQRTNNSTGSSDSDRRCSRKVTRVTSQRPFNLRTEKRGKAKEHDFIQRLTKMQMEEERLRNPLAQGLPYTTEEPETLAKPPMKEPTEPIDLVLHSDVRAVGRAKFDHQVTERNSFMEEVRLERQRQQKVDEEMEIKQLRKEQVTRAHPMPDFTRPFMPKKSVKPHTVPREPRFHSRLMRHTPKA